MSLASALPIAQAHTARPQHRLTAALSSGCQAYANKALSIQHAPECQLSLCFQPFPLLFLFPFFTDLCLSLSLLFLSIWLIHSLRHIIFCPSVSHSLWLLFSFPMILPSSCCVLMYICVGSYLQLCFMPVFLIFLSFLFDHLLPLG